METVIDIHGLVNRIGTELIHDGVDLHVIRGEILALVGASGSGKSVLLRSVTGLRRPDAGTIRVLGEDITGPSESRRRRESRWGVLFQDGALFSSLTVRQNVQAPWREYFHLGRGLMDDLAAFKIDLAGLPASAADKYPSALSPGMRKRAGLARALAMDPDILFLDEPTAGLDPVAAAAFDATLRHLRDRLGFTVFMVTHDLHSLRATCDQVAVLADGKIVYDGPMDGIQLCRHPWVLSCFHGSRAPEGATAWM